jgi:hypothetical protein
LTIQTKFQKELYEKYGHSILCIDATHGTNAYRFMLITCIVPDEFGRGQPIAWCIADTVTEAIVQAFLKTICDRSPYTTVRVIMTDDDDTGWKAAEHVYGNIQHILCRWHIDQ